MKVVSATFILFLLAAGVHAQQVSDACHVYVVDVAKAKRAFERDGRTGKALAFAQTLFPEFYPIIGEEQVTTKHYRFPGSTLVITATVYYTDESMASHPHGEFAGHSESMLIGVAVARKAKPNAIYGAAGQSSITEVTYDQYTNKVRVKKYVTVRGRSYLVGIECDCMVEKRKR